MKSLFEKLKPNRPKTQAHISLDWLNNPGNLDDLTTLEKTTHFLSSFVSDESISDHKRLETLLTLVRLHRQLIAKITRQYTQCDNLRPELETRICELTYRYYRQIYVIYFDLIKKFIAAPDQHIFDYKHLQALLGGAIDAATGMIKWRSFQHMSAPANVWLQLFTIYKIAATEDFLDVPIRLFMDEPSVTISAALSQICMLGSLGQANMNDQQIEITSQLLKIWMPTAKIYKHLEAQKFLFYIDIEKDSGSKRMRKFEPSSSCRYLNLQHFNSLVTEGIAGINSGSMPKHLRLGELGNNKALLDTLHILNTEWSKSEHTRQRRLEGRNKSAKSVTICYGIEAVCTQVLHLANYNLARGARISAEGKSLDERLASHSVVKNAPNVYFIDSGGESGVVTDESTKGLGMRVDKESISKAVRGKLVGIVSKDQKHQIILGIVRAIKPLSRDEHHIGIEIIARNPAWGQLTLLRKSNADLDSDYLKQEVSTPHRLSAFPCLYLPVETGLSKSASLVLPRIEFMQYESYRINIMGTKSLVVLTNVVSGQSDWVRVAVDTLT